MIYSHDGNHCMKRRLVVEIDHTASDKHHHGHHHILIICSWNSFVPKCPSGVSEVVMSESVSSCATVESRWVGFWLVSQREVLTSSNDSCDYKKAANDWITFDYIYFLSLSFFSEIVFLFVFPFFLGDFLVIFSYAFYTCVSLRYTLCRGTGMILQSCGTVTPLWP